MEASMPEQGVSESGQKSPSLWRLLGEDVRCVFQRDPAARSRLEVVLTYPGVHAIIMHRLAHRLWRRNWRFSARVIAFISRALSNVDIHPGASIGRRFFIDHGAGVVIGETAVVGDDCTLYHGVTLGGTSWNAGKRHPTLGNGVMVGAGAKVLGPLELGDGVRVGANSVVVESVPAGRTVIGIPGRVVRNRPASNSAQPGIDLDHHLVPDPVGKAIGCLLDRIDHLERKLRNQAAGSACESCDDPGACDVDQFDSYGNPSRKSGGR